MTITELRRSSDFDDDDQVTAVLADLDLRSGTGGPAGPWRVAERDSEPRRPVSGPNRPNRSAVLFVSVLTLVVAVGAMLPDRGSDVIANLTEPAPSERVAAQTYEVVAGDSLSGIAERSGVTLDELVATNDWADGIDHAIFPGDTVLLPSGATTPTPLDAASDRTAASVDAPSVTAYGPPQPPIPWPVTITPEIAAPLVDGVYFADRVFIDGGALLTELYQYFPCTSVETSPIDRDCEPGFATTSAVSAFVRVAPSATITVNSGTLENQTRVGVSVTEYTRLVSGLTPASDSPDGFRFTPWITFVEVQGGVITDIDQHFTS